MVSGHHDHVHDCGGGGWSMVIMLMWYIMVVVGVIGVVSVRLFLAV